MDEVTADLGWVAAARGEWDEAIRIFGGVAESCRTRGDPAEVGPALQQLGMALHRGGHQAAARERLEAAETVLRSVGDTFVLAGALYDLGRTLHCQGDLEAARGRLTESLSLFVASVDGSGAVFVLDALSRLDVDDGHPERAVRLAARADSLRRRLAAHAPEAIVGRWDVRAAVRGQLPEWAVEAAWAGGTTAPSTDLTELMREATDDIDEPADG
jgi:hypothetical protein